MCFSNFEAAYIEIPPYILINKYKYVTFEFLFLFSQIFLNAGMYL